MTDISVQMCSRGRVVDTFGQTGEKKSRVEFNTRIEGHPSTITTVVDTSDLDMRSDRYTAIERARSNLGLPSPSQ